MAPHSLTNPTATYISGSSSYDQHSHTHVSAFTCPDLGFNEVNALEKQLERRNTDRESKNFDIN
jgi:hypothetical protein